MTTPRQAASECLDLLDGDFLRALAEPTRGAILRILVQQGRCDVGTIASHLPQDRSVVTRHLQTLSRANIVRAESEGRHTFYMLDGPALRRQLQVVQDLLENLVPDCCP